MVWKEDSVCGEGRTINIHHKIFDPEVRLLLPLPIPTVLLRYLSLVNLGSINGEILQIMFAPAVLSVNVAVDLLRIKILLNQEMVSL